MRIPKQWLALAWLSVCLLLASEFGAWSASAANANNGRRIAQARCSQLLPQLVTFNGHRFDLPVLRYRAMVNRVSSGGLQVRQYFHRYTDDALDLCDEGETRRDKQNTRAHREARGN